MNWISVEDKEPELLTYVLVYGSEGINISYLFDANLADRTRARKHKDRYPIALVWYQGCCCEEWGGTITRWAPLPEPPPLPEDKPWVPLTTEEEERYATIIPKRMRGRLKKD